MINFIKNILPNKGNMLLRAEAPSAEDVNVENVNVDEEEDCQDNNCEHLHDLNLKQLSKQVKKKKDKQFIRVKHTPFDITEHMKKPAVKTDEYSIIPISAPRLIDKAISSAIKAVSNRIANYNNKSQLERNNLRISQQFFAIISNVFKSAYETTHEHELNKIVPDTLPKPKVLHYDMFLFENYIGNLVKDINSRMHLDRLKDENLDKENLEHLLKIIIDEDELIKNDNDSRETISNIIKYYTCFQKNNLKTQKNNLIEKIANAIDKSIHAVINKAIGEEIKKTLPYYSNNEIEYHQLILAKMSFEINNYNFVTQEKIKNTKHDLLKNSENFNSDDSKTMNKYINCQYGEIKKILDLLLEWKVKLSKKVIGNIVSLLLYDRQGLHNNGHLKKIKMPREQQTNIQKLLDDYALKFNNIKETIIVNEESTDDEDAINNYLSLHMVTHTHEIDQLKIQDIEDSKKQAEDFVDRKELEELKKETEKANQISNQLELTFGKQYKKVAQKLEKNTLEYISNQKTMENKLEHTEKQIKDASKLADKVNNKVEIMNKTIRKGQQALDMKLEKQKSMYTQTDDSILTPRNGALGAFAGAAGLLGSQVYNKNQQQPQDNPYSDEQPPMGEVAA